MRWGGNDGERQLKLSNIWHTHPWRWSKWCHPTANDTEFQLAICCYQMKLPVKNWVTSDWVCKNPQAIQVFVKTIGCSPQTDTKCLLVKKIPTKLIEYGETNLVPTQNLNPYMLLVEREIFCKLPKEKDKHLVTTTYKWNISSNPFLRVSGNCTEEKVERM